MGQLDHLDRFELAWLAAPGEQYVSLVLRKDSATVRTTAGQFWITAREGKISVREIYEAGRG